MSVIRDIVKLRKVAGSMVVSIPQTILAKMQLAEGDRVLIEASSPNRLVITREIQTMPDTQRVELELAVLEAQIDALNTQSESLVWQHNNSMELDLALMDESVFTLTMMEQNRKSGELQVEVARKRLELFEVKGAVGRYGVTLSARLCEDGKVVTSLAGHPPSKPQHVDMLKMQLDKSLLSPEEKEEFLKLLAEKRTVEIFLPSQTATFSAG